MIRLVIYYLPVSLTERTLENEKLRFGWQEEKARNLLLYCDYQASGLDNWTRQAKEKNIFLL